MHRLVLLTALLFGSMACSAHTLAELKAALARLDGDAPIRGQVAVKSENRSTEGKDEMETKQGVAQIGFDDGPQGLRLHYPQPLLNKAAQEDLAKRANPKSATPASTGLADLGFREVRSMTRAAESLSRLISNAQFKGERMDAWQGQPAKVLSFQLPQTEPNKYVKDFNSVLDVFVAADGTPLGSRATQKVSGRAYVVVSFEFSNEEELHYAVSGDRLVVTRRLSKGGGSGAGEKGSTAKTLTLQLS
jgi:hypothetical protein